LYNYTRFLAPPWGIEPAKMAHFGLWTQYIVFIYKKITIYCGDISINY